MRKQNLHSCCKQLFNLFHARSLLEVILALTCVGRAVRAFSDTLGNVPIRWRAQHALQQTPLVKSVGGLSSYDFS